MASLPLLNFNPRPGIAWKGQVLNQITSSLQKNGEVNGYLGRGNQFRAMPLKHYRREIATSISNANGCPHSRVSSSIDELQRPGGYVITVPTGMRDACGNLLDDTGYPIDKSGLVNIIEAPQPSSLNDTYGCKSNSYNCAEANAKRRCRSSGMIKRKYDPARQELAYFTNTNQYLVSRSMTFLQNQYRHVRTADNSLVTNPLLAKDTYSPNGVSHCPKARVVSGANTFYYYWFDATGTGSTRYPVVIPTGYYDINDFNAVFEQTMMQNGHYLVYNATYSNIFLMKIVYNNSNGAVEIQTYSTTMFYNNGNYSVPRGQSWVLSDGKVPVYYVPDTGIQGVFGFTSGYYPALNSGSLNNSSTSAVGFLSNTGHTLYPSYSIMHYKPSNNRFAVQGGVSSGDMTQRLKYEAITTTASTFTKVFGSQVGSAMAYGISDQAYTVKDKAGYPLTKTPVIDKYTGELKCRVNGRLTGRCATAPNG